MNFLRQILFISLFVSIAQAQLGISMLPLKITGQKAIIPLVIKNSFSEKVDSARAVAFVLNEQGQVVAHGTTCWTAYGRAARSPGKASPSVPSWRQCISTRGFDYAKSLPTP